MITTIKTLAFIWMLLLSPMINALGIGALGNICDGNGANFCDDQVLAEVYIDHRFEIGRKKGWQIPFRLSHESNPGWDDIEYIKGGPEPKTGFINKVGIGLHYEF